MAVGLGLAAPPHPAMLQYMHHVGLLEMSQPSHSPTRPRHGPAPRLPSPAAPPRTPTPPHHYEQCSSVWFLCSAAMAHECAVCLSVLTPDDIDPLTFLPCGHGYHRYCITTYASMRGVGIEDVPCPRCKVTPREMVRRAAQTFDLGVEIAGYSCSENLQEGGWGGGRAAS